MKWKITDPTYEALILSSLLYIVLFPIPVLIVRIASKSSSNPRASELYKTGTAMALGPFLVIIALATAFMQGRVDMTAVAGAVAVSSMLNHLNWAIATSWFEIATSFTNTLSTVVIIVLTLTSSAKYNRNYEVIIL